MTKVYDYNKREQSVSWLIKHIETLLNDGKEYNNSSFILYAIFEARNLLEKISYDLIVNASDASEREEILEIAKGKQGIRKTNSKYKSLKYRFQTFSEALGKVASLPIKAFDYKKAENLETDLGEYIHSYTLTQDEIDFKGEFIQKGIVTIEETLKFVKDYFVLVDKNYVFGILNFSSLTGDYKIEFEKWKSGLNTNTEELYEKLVEINKRDSLTRKE